MSVWRCTDGSGGWTGGGSGHGFGEGFGRADWGVILPVTSLHLHAIWGQGVWDLGMDSGSGAWSWELGACMSWWQKHGTYFDGVVISLTPVDEIDQIENCAWAGSRFLYGIFIEINIIAEC